MPKHGKHYREATSKIEKDRLYAPLEGARLAKESSTAKFDETVEVHFRLGIDTRQADQQVRGSVSLPNGTGKTVRVAVFAEGDKAREAEAAGADVVGSDDLVERIRREGLPRFTYLLLPNDHTQGTLPGKPTPESMIADNDEATGRVIAALTASSSH